MVSAAPYVLENRLLCEEVYEKVPAAATRLLPFACIDPARRVQTQLRELERLSERYPIYGLKLSGVMIQSSHAHLLARGEGFVRFARERNIPILLHTTAYAGDRFCHNSINLRIARQFPSVRFCMAHCMGFDKTCLDEADAMENVFVDSAAMKIQIEVPPEVMAPPERRFGSDYSDFRRVFADLAAAYRRTLIWGSDSPAYSYFEKRRYADGTTVDFCLRGSYAQEKSALDALRGLRLAVANRNTCRFLFGPGKA
jgi:predicted TIM-barrel fold metal-dependent hydrolase